jgi:hypothetical protein
MPHIPRTQSIVNHADNGGAGMKKAGLIRDGYPRVSHRILLSRSPNKVPAEFILTNISSFGRSSYIGRNRIV